MGDLISLDEYRKKKNTPDFPTCTISIGDAEELDQSDIDCWDIFQELAMDSMQEQIDKMLMETHEKINNACEVLDFTINKLSREVPIDPEDKET